MIYLLAFILPPVAVLLKGKPFQALLNLVLTLFFWLPGVIHAWIVINGANADKRMKKQAKLIAEANRQSER
ncbi:YqaE/Pmp3 family membrane protein [Heyndrickxia sp. MSNUG]|uniref:YqaE/Pmp3 family membrane protein n=1 Tax=Heyndrickxia sp. MSNUG TaxID=3136677 RepID=UPI003C2FCE8A